MNTWRTVVNSLIEANGRLWRRSKLLWLVGLLVVGCVCCLGFGGVLTFMPGYRDSATTTAEARAAQGTAQAIVTENAQVAAVLSRTRGAEETVAAVPTATETIVVQNVAVATGVPSETALSTEIPLPSETAAPSETPTVFVVVVTGVPTETPVVPTNTRVVVAATEVSTEAPAPSGSGEVEIVEIHFRGTGQKQPDEYVEIRNGSGTRVKMGGWRFNAGSEGQDFVFAAGFGMEAGQACRIYTNEVHEKTRRDNSPSHADSTAARCLATYFPPGKYLK